MKRTVTTTLSTAALLLAATAASAQIARNGITITVGDDTLLPGESTTIRMEAYFDPMDYCMAAVATSLLSSAGVQGLSDLRLVSPMDGVGTDVGVIDAGGVSGILAGQLNGLGGIYGDPSNPIAFWEATYTAPLDVAVAFDIDLMTRSSRFDVYPDMMGLFTEPRLDDFAEGAAMIRVVPAPAAGVVVLGGLVFSVARRRR